jgi:hypothetical protein
MSDFKLFKYSPVPVIGAAGADAAHQQVNLAIGILPDLRASRGFMDGRVAGLSNWPGMEGIRIFQKQVLCLGNRRLSSFRPSVKTSSAP